MANCTVNGRAALAVVDSESCKTILDVGMVKILGLEYRPAVNGDCVTYSVPGTGQSNNYAGVVIGEVALQLAPGVVYGSSRLKLINHPHPLLLVGSDVLSRGHAQGQWNYAGLRLGTDSAGEVEGHICFSRGGAQVEEKLVNVPTARGSHSAGTKMLGMVAGPPLGG